MEKAKEFVTLAIGYPLCIASLAAVPYGVYSIFVYRWGFTGWLKGAAVVAAAVCAVLAFDAFLCWLHKNQDAERQEVQRQECERYKKLYWVYEDKCNQLEAENRELLLEIEAMRAKTGDK